MLGWRTVCAVEIEPYPASVLCARQNDGLLPPFPIWDDIRTFDGKPWRGLVDVVSGGFPCQDISAAGKGAGITGDRSGLWMEMARVLGEVRPQYAFVENSPALTSRGLGVVLGDLAALGYDASWGVLGSAHVGAPHLRERIWIVAYANEISSKTRFWRHIEFEGEIWGKDSAKHPEMYQQVWMENQPSSTRMVNGVANWMDRLEAIGNGQVPQCAATAFRILADQS